MRIILNSLLIVFAILYSFESCTKQAHVSQSSDSDNATLKYAFNSLKPGVQVFTVTAGIRQTITGNSGTKITFYPNSFKDASGHIITSGTIDILLTEIYKPGDMILSSVFPVTTDNNWLKSGGEINVVATMGGMPVYPNKYQVKFLQPAASTQPMALFPGIISEDSSIAWRFMDSASINAYTVPETPGSTTAYYVFDSCTSFGWLNCDWWADNEKIEGRFALSDTSFNSNNTSVFFVVPSMNAVLRSYNYNGLYRREVPISIPGKIIVIGCKAGTFYYSEQDVTGISDTTTLSVTNPEVQTLSYIKDALSAL